MNRTQPPEASSPIPGKGRRRLLWQFIYIFGTLLLILLLGGNDRQLASLFSGRLPLDGRWLVLCARRAGRVERARFRIAGYH